MSHDTILLQKYISRSYSTQCMRVGAWYNVKWMITLLLMRSTVYEMIPRIGSNVVPRDGRSRVSLTLEPWGPAQFKHLTYRETGSQGGRVGWECGNVLFVGGKHCPRSSEYCLSGCGFNCLHGIDPHEEIAFFFLISSVMWNPSESSNFVFENKHRYSLRTWELWRLFRRSWTQCDTIDFHKPVSYPVNASRILHEPVMSLQMHVCTVYQSPHVHNQNCPRIQNMLCEMTVAFDARRYRAWMHMWGATSALSSRVQAKGLFLTLSFRITPQVQLEESGVPTSIENFPHFWTRDRLLPALTTSFLGIEWREMWQEKRIAQETAKNHVLGLFVPFNLEFTVGRAPYPSGNCVKAQSWKSLPRRSGRTQCQRPAVLWLRVLSLGLSLSVLAEAKTNAVKVSPLPTQGTSRPLVQQNLSLETKFLGFF